MAIKRMQIRGLGRDDKAHGVAEEDKEAVLETKEYAEKEIDIKEEYQ